MQTSQSFTFTLQCCVPHLTGIHSGTVLKYWVTYKPVNTPCTKINVWAKAPAHINFLFKTNPEQGPDTVKRKKTLDMLLLAIKLFNCLYLLFKLNVDSAPLAATFPLRAIQAAWTRLLDAFVSGSAANVTFDPQEEGEGAESTVHGGRGGDVGL